MLLYDCRFIYSFASDISTSALSYVWLGNVRERSMIVPKRNFQHICEMSSLLKQCVPPHKLSRCILSYLFSRDVAFSFRSDPTFEDVSWTWHLVQRLTKLKVKLIESSRVFPLQRFGHRSSWTPALKILLLEIHKWYNFFTNTFDIQSCQRFEMELTSKQCYANIIGNDDWEISRVW